MNEPEDPAAREALDALNASPRPVVEPPDSLVPEFPELFLEEPPEPPAPPEPEPLEIPDEPYETVVRESRPAPPARAVVVRPADQPTVDYGGGLDLPDEDYQPRQPRRNLDFVRGPVSGPPGLRQFGMLHMLAALTGLAALFSFGFAIAVGNGGSVFIAVALSVISTLLTLRLVRGSLKDAEARVLAELDLDIDRTPSRQLKPAMLTLRGERLLWETRLHPLKIFWWWVALGAVFVGTIALGIMSGGWLIAFGAGAAAMVPVGIKIYEWWHSTVAVTDRRLIAVEGVFTIKRPMMPLAKLTDEGIHIPFTSRLLGRFRVIRTKYGSLVVESAGQDQALSRIDYFPAIEPVNQIIAGQAVPRGNDGS